MTDSVDLLTRAARLLCDFIDESGDMTNGTAGHGALAADCCSFRNRGTE